MKARVPFLLHDPQAEDAVSLRWHSQCCSQTLLVNLTDHCPILHGTSDLPNADSSKRPEGSEFFLLLLNSSPQHMTSPSKELLTGTTISAKIAIR